MFLYLLSKQTAVIKQQTNPITIRVTTFDVWPNFELHHLLLPNCSLCTSIDKTSAEMGQKCWLVSSMYVRHNQTRLASKSSFLPDEQIISQKTGLFSKCQGVRQGTNIRSRASNNKKNSKKKCCCLNVDIYSWSLWLGVMYNVSIQ